MIALGALVAIALFFAISAACSWLRRPVTITVNGQSTQVPIHATLAEAMNAQRIVVNPGNYVTVSGAVLEPHGGYAFSANVNGTELSPEDIDGYRVEGNEAITFADGEDRIEEFTATSEVVEPHLRMEGTGYSLQYISQWAEEGVVEHRKGKISGEEADVMTKEVKDCIITCRDLALEGDTKYVALTFDDGPADPYTEQYLKILDKYQIKATFFNLGDSINAYPELAKSVVDAGHAIANHTMAHDQLTADDADTIYQEIVNSAEVIQRTTGVATTHLRPPYGDFTERSWLASRGSVTAAIRWTGDSQDWRLPGVDAIVQNALLNIHSGSIILMHDGGGDRSEDLEALPKIIEQLQDDGYQFVTVCELMRKAGDIPEDICSGTGTMPEGAVWPATIAAEDIEASQG